MEFKKNKILVVDDSQSWVAYHKKLLTQIYGDDFIIETAISAREGYDMVYSNIDSPYILVITDLQMEYDYEPKLAGEWLVEQIKNLTEYSRTSIIMISATYNIRTMASVLQVSCLPKSIAASDLNAYKLAMDELLQK